MNMENIDDIQQDELFGQEFNITVDKKQTPIRIDKFLQNRLFNVTRNKIQGAIANGIITVNDHEVKPNYKIRPLDLIFGIIPKKHDFNAEIVGENIPLNVVFEDEELMIIDKPAGMVVHPGVSNYSGTLVNALRYYFDKNMLPVLEGNESDRPGIVHRIDKNTSGLLLIAKTEDAMTKLASQFFHHTIDREYLALVWGSFGESTGTINVNIGRDPNNRKQMKAFSDNDQGKNAVTHFSVVEDLYYVSLIRCKLETGRTHQIRVHLKHAGHPVFNDDTYGGDKIVKGTIFSKYSQFVKNCFELLEGQALHAHTLGFSHPKTGKQMLFKSELPPNFTSVLEKWRTYVNSRKKELQ